MKLSFAVILLKLKGDDSEPFSRGDAETLFTGAGQGTRNLVDYYLDMSHGQLDLGDSKVFGWLPYGHSAADRDEFSKTKRKEKKDELTKANESLPAGKKLTDEEIDKRSFEHAHGTTRAQIKTWGLEALGDKRAEAESYYGRIYVFNAPLDYFGSGKEVVVNFNPPNPEMFSVDLTGVAHEVGHGLGLQHSAREDNNDEYADAWDIMSAYNVYNNNANSANPDPQRPYNSYGPGLNAINMLNAGWLDHSRVLHAGNASSVKLRPLHRRDLPGYLAAEVGGYWLEFRMDEGWDRGIPEPVVLVHRVGERNMLPCSRLVIANNGPAGPRADLRQGETFESGNNLDIFSPYTSIAVTRIDPNAREAELSVLNRAPRQPPSAFDLFGGVATDGGGLVWVPGRGLVRIPPRSPLKVVVEQIADVLSLQTTAAEGADRVTLDELVTERLQGIRDTITQLIDGRTAPQVPSEPQRQG